MYLIKNCSISASPAPRLRLTECEITTIFLDKEIFAGELGPKVKIRIAELGNSAGLLGGAALLMD